MARVGLVAVLAVAVLAGCGGHATRHAGTTGARTTAATSAVCRALALAVVDDARGLLRAYAGEASPGDLAMYDLREHVAYTQSNRCAPTTIGAALTAKFSVRQFAALIAILPATYARDLQQARACASGSRTAESCIAPAEPVALPGTNKPGGTPHPLVP